MEICVLRKFQGLSVRDGGFHSPEGGISCAFTSIVARLAPTAGGEFCAKRKTPEANAATRQLLSIQILRVMRKRGGNSHETVT
jgi:hypothetical protein